MQREDGKDKGKREGKGLNLEGLLTPTASSQEHDEKLNELRLGDLDLGKGEELSLEGLEGLDNVEEDVQTDKNNCKNCGNKTDTIVFCPECGASFCNHCALQAFKVDDKVQYTCPRCRATFKSGRTSAAFLA